MVWPDREATLVEDRKNCAEQIKEIFGHLGRLSMLAVIVEYLDIEWQHQINQNQPLKAQGIKEAGAGLRNLGDYLCQYLKDK